LRIADAAFASSAYTADALLHRMPRGASNRSGICSWTGSGPVVPGSWSGTTRSVHWRF